MYKKWMKLALKLGPPPQDTPYVYARIPELKKKNNTKSNKNKTKHF